MNTASRGLTLIDTLVAVALTLAMGAMLLPALGAIDDNVQVAVSKNNLRQLGLMHATYANDWDGRQWTVTPDDLSIITYGSYRHDYSNYPDIPPVVLGFDCEGTLWTTSIGWAIQPMWWRGNCSLGNFRRWNTRPFNQYANGKVFDRMFWAPRDPLPADNPEIQEY